MLGLELDIGSLLDGVINPSAVLGINPEAEIGIGINLKSATTVYNIVEGEDIKYNVFYKYKEYTVYNAVDNAVVSTFSKASGFGNV